MAFRTRLITIISAVVLLVPLAGGAAHATSRSTVSGAEFVRSLVQTVAQAHGDPAHLSLSAAAKTAMQMGIIAQGQTTDLGLPLTRAEAAMLVLRAYSLDVARYATADWPSVGGDADLPYIDATPSTGLADQAEVLDFDIGLLRGFPAGGGYADMRANASLTPAEAGWILKNLHSVLATSGTGPAWRWVTSWPAFTVGGDPMSQSIPREEAVAARRLDLMLAVAQGSPVTAVAPMFSPGARASVSHIYAAWVAQAQQLLQRDLPKGADVVAGDNASIGTLGTSELTGYTGQTDLILRAPGTEADWVEQTQPYYVLSGDIRSDTDGRILGLDGSLLSYRLGSFSNATDAVLRAPDPTAAALSADIGAGILTTPEVLVIKRPGLHAATHHSTR